MFDPTTVIYSGRYIYVSRHEKSDYHCGTPWRERLNLLRYQITFFPGRPYRFAINKHGKAALALSNFLFRLRRPSRR